MKQTKNWIGTNMAAMSHETWSDPDYRRLETRRAFRKARRAAVARMLVRIVRRFLGGAPRRALEHTEWSYGVSTVRTDEITGILRSDGSVRDVVPADLSAEAWMRMYTLDLDLFPVHTVFRVGSGYYLEDHPVAVIASDVLRSRGVPGMPARVAVRRAMRMEAVGIRCVSDAGDRRTVAEPCEEAERCQIGMGSVNALH
jgi:hypothetical protein